MGDFLIKLLKLKPDAEFGYSILLKCDRLMNDCVSQRDCRVDRVVFEVPDPWLSPSQSNSCFWDLRQTSGILCHEIY